MSFNSSKGQKKQKRSFKAYLVPLLILQFTTFLVPMFLFLRTAFYENEGLGLVNYANLTFENIWLLIEDEFYRKVIFDTVIFGLLVTVLALIFSFPVAYLISRSRRFRSLLLTLVIVASFTSIIIKVLGWRILLGVSGPINWLVQFLGLSDEPLRLVNNFFGAVLGTAHAVVPLVVLLLVPVIDRVPVQLEEAASGLGAKRYFTFFSVVIPSSRTGIIGGGLIAFAYAMGSFTTPALLGGKSTLILPILIRQQVVNIVNYPMASALSLVLITIVVIVTLISLKMANSKGQNS